MSQDRMLKGLLDGIQKDIGYVPDEVIKALEQVYQRPAWDIAKQDADLTKTAAGLITEHPEWYDQQHGVSKAAVLQPLTKGAMELLLANPVIYDQMVEQGLLP
jgi:hypothetical protein